MKLKDKLKEAQYLKNGDINMFDYLYIMPTRRKHDSGYLMYEIYGSKIDNNKIEHFYILSKCSDVIDFNKCICDYEWFCSIDMPEYNVYRIFTRGNHKFLIPYFHCSSFNIEIRKENNNGIRDRR